MYHLMQNFQIFVLKNYEALVSCVGLFSVELLQIFLLFSPS